MVLEGLGLPIFGGCDQFPNETLDLLVPLIMLDTVHQQGTANHLHVLLVQMPLESPVSQDVLPTTPTDSGNTEGVGRQKGQECTLQAVGPTRPREACLLLGLWINPETWS